MSTNKSHLLWDNDSISSYLTIIGPIVPLISSITCLIILNTYLKVLKEIFKTIINIVLIFNIICFSITIAINSYIVINQSQTFILCSMHMITNNTPVYFACYGITMLSFLRFHIATRIINCESTRKTSCYATTLMILYGIFESVNQGPVSFFSAVILGIPTQASMCFGSVSNEKPFLIVFNLAKVLMILVIGVRYDYLMMNFLKERNKRNEVGQSRLVPWKSGGQEYDLLVPLGATVASAMSSVVALALSIVTIKSVGSDDFEVWKLTSIAFNLICSLQMPFMIGMTIRAAKHKKPGPLIPKGPMFHEPLSDIDAVVKEEDDIEMQEVIQNTDENQIEVDQESFSNDSTYAVSGPHIIHVKPMIHKAECDN